MAYVLPSVSVSTLPNGEGRRFDRFCVVVFSLGLLEALLGKPDTLHSLCRANRHLSPGRPAGPKRCSSPGKVAGRATAGLGVLAASSPIPWVEFVLSYQAGVDHPPKSGG